MKLAAFDGPSPKTPYRRKNLAKISYASGVIANFVPNFVAMTTKFGTKIGYNSVTVVIGLATVRQNLKRNIFVTDHQ